MIKKGLVIQSTGLDYKLHTDEGIYTARLRGNFKLKELKFTNPISVGDSVLFIANSQDQISSIQDILPRKNYIVRDSTKNNRHKHLLASNLDVAILLCTIHSPRTSTGFIDRFLVSAMNQEIPVIIVFNKSDIWDKENEVIAKELIQEYSSIGYTSLSISCLKSIAIKSLREKIKGKICAIAGHSGVGKSTLLNTMNPKLSLVTNQLSSHNKGVHTTTFSRMYKIDNSTFIVDTPGIKEFGLSSISKARLSHLFVEFNDYHHNCKFRNCSHIYEKECAIQELVNSKSISNSRYKNYVKLWHELKQ